MCNNWDLQRHSTGFSTSHSPVLSSDWSASHWLCLCDNMGLRYLYLTFTIFIAFLLYFTFTSVLPSSRFSFAASASHDISDVHGNVLRWQTAARDHFAPLQRLWTVDFSNVLEKQILLQWGSCKLNRRSTSQWNYVSTFSYGEPSCFCSCSSQARCIFLFIHSLFFVRSWINFLILSVLAVWRCHLCVFCFFICSSECVFFIWRVGCRYLWTALEDFLANQSGSVLLRSSLIDGPSTYHFCFYGCCRWWRRRRKGPVGRD